MLGTNINAIYKETVRDYILLRNGVLTADVRERSRIQERHNAVVNQLQFTGVTVCRYNFLTI